MSSLRIAVARLHLKEGRVLYNQLLQLTPQGHLLSYAPLTREQAATPWHRGDWQERPTPKQLQLLARYIQL